MQWPANERQSTRMKNVKAGFESDVMGHFGCELLAFPF